MERDECRIEIGTDAEFPVQISQNIEIDARHPISISLPPPLNIAMLVLLYAFPDTYDSTMYISCPVCISLTSMHCGLRPLASRMIWQESRQ